ncbi:MAG: hypothetical protein M0R03_23510 [Novosphingobium sp.]|jgi:hypothetical protein|nr:hypothetical protein [Novosphingobium sp.]MDD5355025.1 hypothetical protein [Candidatus Omnitrophota bacterium]
MKIAATVTDFVQVGIGQYELITRGTVFDSSESLTSILNWAQGINPHHNLNTIRLSEVVEDYKEAHGKD